MGGGLERPAPLAGTLGVGCEPRCGGASAAAAALSVSSAGCAGRHRRLRSRRMHGAGRRLGHFAWRCSAGRHRAAGGGAGRGLGRVRQRRRRRPALGTLVLGAEQRRQRRAQDLGSRELDLLRRGLGGAGPPRAALRTAVALASASADGRRQEPQRVLAIAAWHRRVWPRGGLGRGRLLLSGASSSVKSSSSAAPLTGPLSAPASLADKRPSSSAAPVSAGASGSGAACAGIGAAARCPLAASLAAARTGSCGSTRGSPPGSWLRSHLACSYRTSLPCHDRRPGPRGPGPSGMAKALSAPPLYSGGLPAAPAAGAAAGRWRPAALQSGGSVRGPARPILSDVAGGRVRLPAPRGGRRSG